MNQKLHGGHSVPRREHSSFLVKNHTGPDSYPLSVRVVSAWLLFFDGSDKVIAKSGYMPPMVCRLDCKFILIVFTAKTLDSDKDDGNSMRSFEYK
ncbi:hypothetical protein [Methylocaldum sp.]|uniref:hypothetical protein n=1 Tax=Methylocaldum sp. TaxID=1969727 RepID=UPI002D30E411|nr:hypothetical protein [Methylocaldum sp.]HYE35163.1 hypothetical protein [Methylocaldum sp.]